MAVGNLSLPSQLLSGCDSGFFVCLAEWTNDVTGGAFWVMILMSFAIVVMISTSSLGKARSFAYAGTVGMLASIWLGILNLVPWWITALFIIIGFAGISTAIISER